MSKRKWYQLPMAEYRRIRSLPNDHWEVATGVTCLKLTRNRYALIDTSDYLSINSHRWYASEHKVGLSNYVLCGITLQSGKRGILSIHRLLTNAPLGLVVDHINGNGLDNRRENLRVVTHRENMQNIHTPKSSRYPGVTWDKERQKWIVHIRKNRKGFYLGRFADEEMAAKAYRDAVVRLNENCNYLAHRKAG
jgi:hypothetical protein